MPQVGRRLIFLGWHQKAAPAYRIDLPVDGDIGIAFDAIVLLPGDVLLATVISW
jgi:hypothetical protein